MFLKNIFIKSKLIVLFLTSLYLFGGCNSKTSFSFVSNDEGIELLENGKPVLFYQQKMKFENSEFSRNNYIHPLYSLTGDTLTEDFPKDHPHHRGVFWAWHQIYHDTNKISDSWVVENFSNEIVDVKTNLNNNSAIIKIVNLWKSPLFSNGKAFVKEYTTITTHKSNHEFRIIDFKIKLLALVNGISIGGSDDEKGYGGFSLRIKMPDGLIFTSNSGEVKPRKLQISSYPWMDFSAPFAGKDAISGVTVICNKQNYNYPQPWILRQKNSMQNVVFPGRERVKLSTKKPLILNYRLIVHDGKGIKAILKEINNYLI